MADIRFADYCVATLIAPITANQTTVTLDVQSGTIPSIGGGPYLYFTLIDEGSYLNNTVPPTSYEVVKATAVSGSVYTIQRGIGSTPSQFAMGDYCVIRVNTAALNDLANGNAGTTVTSIACNDGSLIITPTTGNVIATLNPAPFADVAFSGDYADLTGTPTLAAIATSGSASDLITGTVPAARLPFPGLATIGGVVVATPVTHQFMTGIAADGVSSLSQPSFADISGTIDPTQVVLPTPTLSTLGGVKAINAVSHQFLTSIATSGTPAQARPAFTDISGSAVAAQLPSSLDPDGGIVKAIAPASQFFITGVDPTNTMARDTVNFSVLTGILDAGQMCALTGDVTAVAETAITTLATVNASPGTFTNSTITVNGKGLVTSASSGAGGGTGAVNNGTINQLAYYAANGTTISGQTLFQASNMPVLTGDVTTAGGTLATTVVGLQAGVAAAGKVIVTNIALPASPSAGTVAVYSDSTDLVLKSRSAFGTVSTMVNNTRASRLANNFMTFVNAAGAIAYAQPVQADVVGLTTADTPVFAGVSLTTNPTPNQGGVVTGRYYSPWVDLSNTTPMSLTQDILYVTPFYCGAVTWTKIGFYITTGAAGNAHLGIYTLVNGIPTTLVLDAGTVSTAAGGSHEITISQALNGTYCLVILCSATISVYGKSLPTIQQAFGTGAPGTGDYQLSSAFPYAALPTPFPAISYASGECPNLWLRK